MSKPVLRGIFRLHLQLLLQGHLSEEAFIKFAKCVVLVEQEIPFIVSQCTTPIVVVLNSELTPRSDKQHVAFLIQEVSSLS